MNTFWNSDQLKIRSRFLQFGRETVKPSLKRHAATFPLVSECWEKLVAEGFWELTPSADRKGEPHDWWNFAAALEGLAYGCADLGFLLSVMGNAWVMRAINEFGTQSQKEQWLPALRRGAIAATAISEPHSGTDIRNLKSELKWNGQHWELTGSKQHISNAGVAQIILMPVRLIRGSETKIQLLVLESKKHMVDYSPGTDKLGLDTLQTADMSFKQLIIGESEFFGKNQNALELLGNIMNFGRCLIGICASATLDSALSVVLEHSETRVSSGVPINTYQYVQLRLSSVKLLVEETRCLSYSGLDALLSRQPNAGAMGSIVKIKATEALIEGSKQLMAVAGSSGFKNHFLGRLAKDALGFLSVGGTEELHRINIFAQMRKRNL